MLASASYGGRSSTKSGTSLLSSYTPCLLLLLLGTPSLWATILDHICKVWLSQRSPVGPLPLHKWSLFSPLPALCIYLSLTLYYISWLLVDISIYCTRKFADWLVRWMYGWMEDRWIPWHQRRLILGKFWQLPHHS